MDDSSPEFADNAPGRLARLLAAPLDRVRRTPRRYLAIGLGGMVAYLVAMRLAEGHSRGEQLALCAGMAALLLWSDATRRFLLGLTPFALFGIVYDLTHITEKFVSAGYFHIHVDEPYWFDKTFFGIPTAAGRLTPNEFFAIHHWPVADLFTGLAYIVFVYWAIAFGAYLALFRRDEAGRRMLSRFGWTFLFMNLAGFATYYVYPAAPPWYVADYGLGPANLAAQSSAAGAARFDQLLGISYFSGFYGRSADVFGAIPSLHVSYPLLTWCYALELGKRWFTWASFALFLLVCFAAVYLNHHYVLDVLLGILYTLVAWGIERGLRAWRARRAAAAAAAAGS